MTSRQEDDECELHQPNFVIVQGRKLGCTREPTVKPQHKEKGWQTTNTHTHTHMHTHLHTPEPQRAMKICTSRGEVEGASPSQDSSMPEIAQAYARQL